MHTGLEGMRLTCCTPIILYRICAAAVIKPRYGDVRRMLWLALAFSLACYCTDCGSTNIAYVSAMLT